MSETDKEARIRLAGEVLTLTGEIITEKQKVNAIQTEVDTYHGRRMTVMDYKKTAHFTIELIDKILDGSYFKEKGE